MSEEEQIQTMQAQLSRIARVYLPKAKEIERVGRWPRHALRTLEQPIELRIAKPLSLHQRAKKAMDVLVNKICPIWSIVNKREQQSGWGRDDFIRETKKKVTIVKKGCPFSYYTLLIKMIIFRFWLDMNRGKEVQ